MKTITIKNLIIQFEGNIANVDPVLDSQETIDLINKILQEANLTSQPQIMSSGLDSSDVEVENNLEEE